ncbi:MAG: hypothetical protein V3U88_01345 [Methylococcales bacterium]
MNMTESLLTALKGVFKHKGITYKDAAIALNLSEISIKRIFSEHNTSLVRLEKLCEFAKTDFGELMQLAEQASLKIAHLTVEQEQELVRNKKLLLLGVCLINHWTFDDILSKYQFEETELIRLFAQMDRLKIIEYLPGNRYRLNIARDFYWQPNGPIHRYFAKSILDEYLSGKLPPSTNHFRFVWGMLSKQSAQELNQKIKRLIDDYLQIAQQDARIPVNDKMTSSLMIVFREDWEPDEFKTEWRS